MTQSVQQRFENAGFTLIEMLVVISIISILAGLSMVMVMSGGQTGRVSAEEARIAQIVLSAKTFETEYGDYPPSTLEDIGIKANGVNGGIESLYAHLETRKHGGPFIDDVATDDRGNTDSDELSASQLKKLKQRIDWARDGSKLFELVDLWGSPYVYIHCRDYKLPAQVQSMEGQVFPVRAAKDPETGGYINPNSFQLWSIGPNGINENGDGDDICSWKR